MGHIGQMSWESGFLWGIQSEYEISLDDVECSTGEWKTCSYKFDHDCIRNEAVFLQCEGIGELIQ
jgi:hypothetical protein